MIPGGIVATPGNQKHQSQKRNDLFHNHNFRSFRLVDIRKYGFDAALPEFRWLHPELGAALSAKVIAMHFDVIFIVPFIKSVSFVL